MPRVKATKPSPQKQYAANPQAGITAIIRILVARAVDTREATRIRLCVCSDGSELARRAGVETFPLSGPGDLERAVFALKLREEYRQTAELDILSALTKLPLLHTSLWEKGDAANSAVEFAEEAIQRAVLAVVGEAVQQAGPGQTDPSIVPEPAARLSLLRAVLPKLDSHSTPLISLQTAVAASRTRASLEIAAAAAGASAPAPASKDIEALGLSLRTDRAAARDMLRLAASVEQAIVMRALQRSPVQLASQGGGGGGDGMGPGMTKARSPQPALSPPQLQPTTIPSRESPVAPSVVDESISTAAIASANDPSSGGNSPRRASPVNMKRQSLLARANSYRVSPDNVPASTGQLADPPPIRGNRDRGPATTETRDADGKVTGVVRHNYRHQPAKQAGERAAPADAAAVDSAVRLKAKKNESTSAGAAGVNTRVDTIAFRSRNGQAGTEGRLRSKEEMDLDILRAEFAKPVDQRNLFILNKDEGTGAAKQAMSGPSDRPRALRGPQRRVGTGGKAAWAPSGRAKKIASPPPRPVRVPMRSRSPEHVPLRPVPLRVAAARNPGLSDDAVDQYRERGTAKDAYAPPAPGPAPAPAPSRRASAVAAKHAAPRRDAPHQTSQSGNSGSGRSALPSQSGLSSSLSLPSVASHVRQGLSTGKADKQGVSALHLPSISVLPESDRPWMRPLTGTHSPSRDRATGAGKAAAPIVSWTTGRLVLPHGLTGNVGSVRSMLSVTDSVASVRGYFSASSGSPSPPSSYAPATSNGGQVSEGGGGAGQWKDQAQHFLSYNAAFGAAPAPASPDSFMSDAPLGQNRLGQGGQGGRKEPSAQTPGNAVLPDFRLGSVGSYSGYTPQSASGFVASSPYSLSSFTMAAGTQYASVRAPVSSAQQMLPPFRPGMTDEALREWARALVGSRTSYGQQAVALLNQDASRQGMVPSDRQAMDALRLQPLDTGIAAAPFAFPSAASAISPRPRSVGPGALPSPALVPLAAAFPPASVDASRARRDSARPTTALAPAMFALPADSAPTSALPSPFHSASSMHVPETEVEEGDEPDIEYVDEHVEAEGDAMQKAPVREDAAAAAVKEDELPEEDFHGPEPGPHDVGSVESGYDYLLHSLDESYEGEVVHEDVLHAEEEQYTEQDVVDRSYQLEVVVPIPEQLGSTACLDNTNSDLGYIEGVDAAIMPLTDELEAVTAELMHTDGRLETEVRLEERLQSLFVAEGIREEVEEDLDAEYRRAVEAEEALLADHELSRGEDEVEDTDVGLQQGVNVQLEQDRGVAGQLERTGHMDEEEEAEGEPESALCPPESEQFIVFPVRRLPAPMYDNDDGTYRDAHFEDRERLGADHVGEAEEDRKMATVQAV